VTDRNSRRHLYGGAITSFGIRIAGVAATFAGNALLARTLTKTEYGYYAYTVELVALLAVVLAVGFTQLAVRVVPDFVRADDGAALARFARSGLVVIAMMALLVAPVLFIAWRAGVLTEGLPLRLLAIGMALLIATSCLGLFQEILRGGQRIAWSQVVEQTVWPVALIAIALAAHQGVIAISPALVMAVQAGVFFAGAVLLARVAASLCAAGSAGGTAQDAENWRDWLRMGSPLAIAGLMSVFLKRGDILALGVYVPPAEIAPYSAAVRIAGLMIFGLAAANAASAAMVRSHWRANDEVALQATIDRSAVIAFGFSAPLALAFWFLPDLFLGAFGSGYLTAATILRILALGQLVNALTGPVGTVVVAAGLERLYMTSMMIVALLMAVALAIVVPRAGPVGAAATTAMMSICLNVWLAAVVRRRLGLHTYVTPAGVVAFLADIRSAAGMVIGLRRRSGDV
jgi:O-antigen/teichoic acid export membrane protein